MSNIVEEQQATVYKATNGTRRHFTKRGAYKHSARQRIKEACQCEEPVGSFGQGYGGYTCKYHRPDFDFERLTEILARILMKKDTNKASGD